LGVAVVAEGVENVDQLRVLGEMGCDMVQGHLVAPALAPQDVAAWTEMHSGGWRRLRSLSSTAEAGAVIA
ncbi:MAG TPA: EAL domain-containing protein, partial [Ilumatobacteraceae bacterium]|nr:EAL domain-containing protein [Ilumatobacteraceae bacterium]